MLVVDGAQGEGGGQVLRTSLGLSMVTGTPFRIERIRARREKPGLMRQHLTGVRACAEICSAELSGDALGSTELTFRPGRVRPGTHRFPVGTAGSVGLVLQAILPALLTAPGSFDVVIEGGTHAAKAPPADFVLLTLLPLLRRMGASIEGEVERHGFYPAGGGRLRIVAGPGALTPFELPDRGAPVARLARALVANLPEEIGERELVVLRHRLLAATDGARVESLPSDGPGNAVIVELQHEHLTEVVSAFGARGRTAEAVAEEASTEARRYLASEVPVGEHLCDQLLVPMALAGRGSFRTMPPTLHSTTNAGVIRLFLDVPIRFMEERAGSWRCTAGA